jgi:hypothetical protein
VPKRINQKLYRTLLAALLERDGDVCILCGASPVVDATIDHLNGIITDNRLKNLHRMCRGCNTGERNRGRRRLLTAESIAFFRVHWSLKPLPLPQVTPVCEDRKPPALKWNLSTAEEANLVLEPLYRRWIFLEVKTKGGIFKSDAIHGGAEYLEKSVGRGSPATTERYFQKIISCQGWLVEQGGVQGFPQWVFRLGSNLTELETRLFGQREASGQHANNTEIGRE